MKRTPFFENHKSLNAKIVNFGGFEMPLQYEGIRQEHNAVRNAAGLFDVSHMGEFLVCGPNAHDLLQYVTINDVSKLSPGTAQYTAMCYEDGGIVDDLILYMIESEHYMMVVNASNIEKDWNWINKHNSAGAQLVNVSEKTALLALQGPDSLDILSSLTDADVKNIGFYKFTTGRIAGENDIIISATGYTGEKGYELYIDTEVSDAVHIWNAIMDAGVAYGLMPAGLGARDTLRLEMGFALYGNDLTKDTSPLEARLGWLTKLDKGEFLGREALLKQKEEGIIRRLTGFVMNEEKQVPRKDYDICDSDGKIIGFVTSGSQSITLGKGIGMGYISSEKADEGMDIRISIRNKLQPATVKKPPFIHR
ncbi:MAG: glycine cleavage system aminomethyltransferase GcvT [Balneolaceae bacterium]